MIVLGAPVVSEAPLVPVDVSLELPDDGEVSDPLPDDAAPCEPFAVLADGEVSDDPVPMPEADEALPVLDAFVPPGMFVLDDVPLGVADGLTGCVTTRISSTSYGVSEPWCCVSCASKRRAISSRNSCREIRPLFCAAVSLPLPLCVLVALSLPLPGAFLLTSTSGDGNGGGACSVLPGAVPGTAPLVPFEDSEGVVWPFGVADVPLCETPFCRSLDALLFRLFDVAPGAAWSFADAALALPVLCVLDVSVSFAIAVPVRPIAEATAAICIQCLGVMRALLFAWKRLRANRAGHPPLSKAPLPSAAGALRAGV